MSSSPRVVRQEECLDQAARVLWEQDCGFVPVVDGADMLVGVVTDRDLCMASFSQSKALAAVPVTEVMTRQVTICQPEDALSDAMAEMAKAQVHRMPVVDDQGALVGVLSVSDVMQLAAARPTAVPAKQLVATMAAITKPRSGGRDFTAKAKGAAAPRKKAAAKKATAKKATAKKAEPTKTEPAKTEPKAKSASAAAAKGRGKNKASAD